MKVKESISKVFVRLVAEQMDILDVSLKGRIDDTLFNTIKKLIRENVYTEEKLIIKEIFFIRELSEIDIQNELKKEREEQNGK